MRDNGCAPPSDVRVATQISRPPIPQPAPIKLPRDSELPKVPTPSPNDPSKRKARLTALGVVLLLAFLAVTRLVAPLWVGLVFGTAMAFTAQPFFRWICCRIHKRWLAALITTIVTGVAWVVVGGSTLYFLAREAWSVAGTLQEKIKTGTLEDILGHKAVHVVDWMGISRATVMHEMRDRLNHVTGDLTAAAGVILSTTGTAMLGLVIGLMTMYYVLIDWATIAVRLERILPLDPRHTRLLILEFRDVGRSAMAGSALTAVAQGVLGGLGYWIAGIPHAPTFGLLTFIGSFLPAVGTALVWVPLGVWLIVNGSLAAGIGLLIWGLLAIVGVCDYVIRPRLVGKEEHPLLTLLALLGGLEVFGLAGLLVGPVLMALFVAILRIYEREKTVEAPKLAEPPNVPEKL